MIKNQYLLSLLKNKSRQNQMVGFRWQVLGRQVKLRQNGVYLNHYNNLTNNTIINKLRSSCRIGVACSHNSNQVNSGLVYFRYQYISVLISLKCLYVDYVDNYTKYVNLDLVWRSPFYTFFKCSDINTYLRTMN